MMLLSRKKPEIKYDLEEIIMTTMLNMNGPRGWIFHQPLARVMTANIMGRYNALEKKFSGTDPLIEWLEAEIIREIESCG
jgi:hypothetical protein